MTRGEILGRLQRLGAATFGGAPDQLQESTVAADIPKWDSLRHLIFISGVEQEFGIEFDLDAIARLTNVGDLIGLIERDAA
jgi:acyl carrier protein